MKPKADFFCGLFIGWILAAFTVSGWCLAFLPALCSPDSCVNGFIGLALLGTLATVLFIYPIIAAMAENATLYDGLGFLVGWVLGAFTLSGYCLGMNPALCAPGVPANEFLLLALFGTAGTAILCIMAIYEGLKQ